MTFPQTPLDVLIELFISGAWTNITSDVYTRDGIHITRGRQDEGGQTDPGKCTLTLNNRSGKYSPRNPLSPYYGLIGRNTPIRISVNAGDSYLATTGTTGGSTGASTPDAAALDITGDIDIRFEARLNNWTASGSVELAGKGLITGNQRSWLLLMRDRKLHFEWSTAGTSTIEVNSTVVLPFGSERTAVRVTLDVDNGASGNTTTFYVGPSISGPWTQLGAPVVNSGTTSIFNSSAPVRVGDGWGDLAFPSSSGAVYAFELRSGIAGSVVANPNFRVQAPGTTSFADGTGKTWTVGNSTTISNRKTRFTGEVPAWPSRWDVSGKDVYVPIEAAGILRRLGQGKKALDSTLRRRIPSFSPLAYWPLEEGERATQAASPITGVRPLQFSRVSWAQANSLASSNPLPVLASSGSLLAEMYGTVPLPASPLTSWHVQYVYRLDQGNTTTRTFLRILSTGSIAEWYIQQSTTGSTVLGKDSDGNTVFTQAIGTGSDLYGQWMRVKFQVTQNGGNLDWIITWTDIGGDAGQFSASVAGTLGRPTAVASPPDGYSPDLNGMAIGHISAWPSNTTTAYDGAIDAWAGETAGARMTRLASEETQPLIQLGDATAQERVGAQTPDTFLNVVEDAADADGGILYERRELLGLAYRDRISLYNQTPTATLNYLTSGHIAPPLEPVDDDQQVRNDRTVQREGGSFGRAVLDTGPLSVQDPPGGVGIYDDTITLNLYDDGQPDRHAGWRLHLGTWDEERYPVLNIDLAAAPSLIETVTEIDSGARLTIANPPAWLPPGLIDLLAQGYTEVIGHPIDWDFQFNCTPGGPWTVAVYDTDRRDTASSKLAAAVTSTATSLPVLTTLGPLWTTAAGDMPLDLLVGGERVTATAIAPWLADAFGRTTSNGWGTSDSGQAWNTVGGGPASDYSVGSGYGVQVLSTLDVSRRTAVTAVHADFDVYADITTSALATGDSLYGAATARMQDASNMYLVRVEFTTSNSIIMSLRKIIADVQTQLGTFTLPFTHVAGTFVRVRFQGTGTSLKAKGWLASGAEPVVWHIEATDSAITAANQIGTRSIRSTGNTNSAAVEVRYDNIQVINPQTITATRSVNGIVKAQAANTAVQLFQPAIRAL